MSELIITEATSVAIIRRGDVIWAPDDGDWLLVDRITTGEDEVTFYRNDHSEATFDKRLLVLRKR